MFALPDREVFEVVFFLCLALAAGWLRRRAIEPHRPPPRIAERKPIAPIRRWCH